MKQRSHEVVTLVRGSLINLTGGLLNAVAGFATIFLLTRIIDDVADVGAFLTAVAAVTLAGRLAQLGATTGLVRFVAQAHGQRRPGTVPTLLVVGAGPGLMLSSVIGIALVAGADTVAALVSDPHEAVRTAEYLRLFGGFTPAVTLLGASAAASRGFGTMTPSTMFENVTRPALQLTALVAVAAWGAGTAVAGLAYWVPVALAGAGMAGFVVTRVSRTHDTVTWDGDLVRAYWRFTAPRAASGMLTTTIEWSDVLLIAALAGTAEAGVYAAATRFLVLGRAVQHAATRALLPQVSRLLSEGDGGAAGSTYRAATAWSLGLTWPWFLFVVVFADSLLGLFGPEFVPGATAVRILALAWMLGTALGPAEAVLLMLGRSAWNLYDVTAALTVNVTLNLLLIPRLGIAGAATAWFASIAVNNVLPVLQVRHLTGLLPFSRGGAQMAATAVLCGVGPALLARLAVPHTAAALATGALGVAGAYVVALQRLGVLRRARSLAAAAAGRRPSPALMDT